MSIFSRKKNRGEAAHDFIKRTLYDLTHIEINTIVKSDMMVARPPDKNRMVFHQLARIYHNTLVDLGRKYGPHLPAGETDINGFRGKMVWVYSGLHSFDELKDRATTAMELMKGLPLEVPGVAPHVVRRDTMLLQRIQIKSVEMMDIFYELRKNISTEREVPAPAALSPVAATGLHSNPEVSPTAPSGTGEAPPENPQDRENISWNNDINLRTINESEDLDLDLTHRIQIRKALDIGTEEVMMQSIIALDGDVTTRVLEKFANDPNQMLLGLHNHSLELSVNYWEKILNSLVTMGKTIFTSKK